MYASRAARWSAHGIAMLIAAIAVSLLALPSSTAADADPPAWIFPIVGQDGVDFDYYDTFGAPRGGGRTHEGVDIGTYGVKGVPVVAAASGVVRYVNWSSDPGNINPSRCCTISIDHAGGVADVLYPPQQRHSWN